MSVEDIYMRELAVRAIVLDIEAEGTLLRKTAEDGGREYEAASLSDNLQWNDDGDLDLADAPTLVGVTVGVLSLIDTGVDHVLSLAIDEDLTADRQLNFYVDDADRDLHVLGDATVSQDYSTTGTPQFASLSLGRAATAGYHLDIYSADSDAVGALVSAANTKSSQFAVIADGMTGNIIAYGSAATGTIMGVNKADCFRISTTDASNMVVGTAGSVPLILGTNNTACLTFSSTGTPTFAAGLQVQHDHITETTAGHGVVVDCAQFDTPSVLTGRYSENVGASHANYWYPVAKVTVTSQYGYGSTDMLVNSIGATAGSSTGMALIHLTVKQQAALGGAPIVDLRTVACSAPLYPMDVVFVLTTNDGTKTEGTLYIRQRNSYDAFMYSAFGLCGNIVMIASNTAGVNALPAGTQYESYGGVVCTQGELTHIGRQGEAGILTLWGDNIGDNDDGMRLYSVSGSYNIQEYASGSWRTNLGMDSSGYLYAPGANRATTATAANVWIDSTTGQLKRSTSSLKYKGDVKDLDTKDSERIFGLRPVSFRERKQEYDGGEKGTHTTKVTDILMGSRMFGLIAEEVAQVMPEVVSYHEGEPDGVQYDRIIAPLIAEVKRLRDRVAVLEKK